MERDGENGEGISTRDVGREEWGTREREEWQKLAVFRCFADTKDRWQPPPLMSLPQFQFLISKPPQNEDRIRSLEKADFSSNSRDP